MTTMNEEDTNPSPAVENENSEVGYCAPPKQHWFKKGQSGNPKGRQRKRESDPGAILREELHRPITIKEDGKKKKLPVIQALIRRDLMAAFNNKPISKITSLLLHHAIKNDPGSMLSTEDFLVELNRYRPILRIDANTKIPKNPKL